MRTQSKQVQILIISILALLIPFCAYYIFYISYQTKYFTKRNFRLLAGISEQMSMTITNLNQAFCNAINDAKSKSKPGTDLETHVSLDHIPKLTLIKDQSSKDNSSGNEIDSGLRLDIRHDGNTSWLYFNYAGLQARCDLNEVFKPFVKQNAFDEILVVQQQDGTVIFQNTPARLKIASLKTLKDKNGREVPLKAHSLLTNILYVHLADTEYRAYMQPARIPVSMKVNNSILYDPVVANWAVCGLIRSSRFNSECRAISSNYLIKVIFLVLIISLCWPLFKLLLMGQRDRLGMSDVSFLGLSLIMVSAFLTFALIDAYSYFFTRDKIDHQLKTFSEKIHENFNNEIRAIHEELKMLNKKIILPKDIAKSRNQQKDQEEVDIFKGGLVKLNDPYPYFTSAIWIDDTGHQRVKWTVKDRTTPFIDVSTRDYFRKAHEDWLFEKKCNEPRVWFESIYSSNSGESTSVISLPWADQNTKWVACIDTRFLTFYQSVLPPGFGFCVIDTTGKVLFHSDETKNLREDFLLECDNNYALRSAVFGHANGFFNVRYEGNDHRIYSSPLSYGDFHGGIMVFCNKELTRIANLQILTVSSVLLLLLLCIPLVVFGLYCLVRLIIRMFLPRRGAFSHNFRGQIFWLWPNKEWAEKYGEIIFFNIILCFILCGGIIYFQNWKIILCTVSVYLLGILLIFSGVKKEQKFLKTWLSRVSLNREYRTRYTLAVVSSLILLVVLPSIAFFKFAYNEEMNLFVKHTQVNLAASLEARQERVMAQYLKINFGQDDDKKEFLRERLKFENMDVYNTCFFDTDTNTVIKPDVNGAQSMGKRFLSHFLSIIRPHYKQICIEINGLMKSVSDDKVWWWKVDAGKLVFLKRGYKNEGKKEAVLSLSSLVPVLAVPSPHFWWVWILLLILLIILFFIVKFVLRRVFLFDLHVPSPLYKETEKEGFSYLLLDASYTKKTFLQSICSEHLIDLKEEIRDGEDIWYKKFITKTYLDSHVGIVIDNFDYQWDDPLRNWEKLEFLEKLFICNKKVIIVSGVHPDNFKISAESFTENQSRETGGKQGKIFLPNFRERWQNIFQTFPVNYSQDCGNPDAFRKEMGAGNDAIKLLYRECKPKEYLQSIGRRLNKSALQEYRPGQLMQIIFDNAWQYYHSLWNTLSRSEKCTIYYLAKDGFLSAKNPDIPRLLMRRIITQEPQLRIMNTTFQKFIVVTSSFEDVVVWKKEARSIWNTTKGPFAGMLIGVALLMYLAQRELFNSTIAIFSGFTAALPAIFRLVGLIKTESGEDKEV